MPSQIRKIAGLHKVGIKLLLLYRLTKNPLNLYLLIVEASAHSFARDKTINWTCSRFLSVYFSQYGRHLQQVLLMELHTVFFEIICWIVDGSFDSKTFFQRWEEAMISYGLLLLMNHNHQSLRPTGISFC
jgi:hypothetical protein